jgi:hypothetical protein
MIDNIFLHVFAENPVSDDEVDIRPVFHDLEMLADHAGIDTLFPDDDGPLAGVWGRLDSNKFDLDFF